MAHDVIAEPLTQVREFGEIVVPKVYGAGDVPYVQVPGTASANNIKNKCGD